MTDAGFRTGFDPVTLEAYHKGVMGYRYRGVLCNKSPIDVAIYLQLLHEAKPQTIIEIGSKAGGSALMLRDFGRTICRCANIVSIDVSVPAIAMRDVTFLQGDVNDLAPVFARHALDALPRPWFVIEDSAHTADGCAAALDFFARRLNAGEWLVMEDGVLDDLGLSGRYGGGPNKAIADFSAAFPGVFTISRRHCDMFGPNLTYNPNGYLQRTAANYDG